MSGFTSLFALGPRESGSSCQLDLGPTDGASSEGKGEVPVEDESGESVAEEGRPISSSNGNLTTMCLENNSVDLSPSSMKITGAEEADGTTVTALSGWEISPSNGCGSGSSASGESVATFKYDEDEGVSQEDGTGRTELQGNGCVSGKAPSPQDGSGVGSTLEEVAMDTSDVEKNLTSTGKEGVTSEGCDRQAVVEGGVALEEVPGLDQETDMDVEGQGPSCEREVAERSRESSVDSQHKGEVCRLWEGCGMGQGYS